MIAFSFLRRNVKKKGEKDHAQTKIVMDAAGLSFKKRRVGL